MIGQQRTKKRTAVNRRSARQLLDSFGTLVGEEKVKHKPLEAFISMLVKENVWNL